MKIHFLLSATCLSAMAGERSAQQAHQKSHGGEKDGIQPDDFAKGRLDACGQRKTTICLDGGR
jgi:hypothetical protein